MNLDCKDSQRKLRIAQYAWRRRVDTLRIKSERFMKKKTVSTFVRVPR